MFEDNFQSYLKTCLHNIWRLFFASCSNVCYVMYEDLLTQHFKHVWRRIHTMLADMLTQNWWHLLQICEVIFITICSKWCQLLKARQTYPKDVWIVFQAIWSVKMPQSGVGSIQGKNTGNMPSAVCASSMNKSLSPLQYKCKVLH